MLLAVIVVLVAVFFVATGRGGELSYERADYAPLDLGQVSATDVALLRPPAALWGYNIQATDEALDRIAHAMRDRDATIASLQEQLAAITPETAQDPPPARASRPGSVRPGRRTVQFRGDLPSSGGDDAQMLKASRDRRRPRASQKEVSRGDDTQRPAPTGDDTQRLVPQGDATQRVVSGGDATQRLAPYRAGPSDAGPSEAELSAAGQSRTSEHPEAGRQGPGGRRDAADSKDVVYRDQPAAQEDLAVSGELPAQEHPGSGDDPPPGEDPANQSGSAGSRAGE